MSNSPSLSLIRCSLTLLGNGLIVLIVLGVHAEAARSVDLPEQTLVRTVVTVRVCLDNGVTRVLDCGARLSAIASNNRRDLVLTGRVARLK